MTRRSVVICVLFVMAAVMMLGAHSVAQATDAQVDKTLESVRADMRADKVAIVTEAMNLSPAEGEKFWPVYREYEAEVVKLNDSRIAMVKEYAAKFTTMTDADAKTLADKFFDWETRRTELRKKYFPKFAKATSATTAAKFFQVEHRLDLLVDLKIASEIPGLFVKSASVSSER